ncbi:MAG TPA: class I SAM-dependent methyltransferase [Candidatus Sulfotelmatobacter sp.]|nr:class I SAM-dependent methyltransferase [Candidatus Sulfotelmatobacter sp.]
MPEPHATTSDHVARNRVAWDAMAPDYVAAAERNWAQDEPTWGIWGVPERELHLLPDELAGLDTIELGCGTAYVSAWLARRGARPVGIDNSPAQLATARRMQAGHGLAFPVHLGDAEATPFADASFDLAISEYGAAIWCDPDRWIPEAARILRPGGRLVFLGNSTLLMLAVPDEEDQPATDRLLRPQRGIHRFEWPDDPGVEFHLGHGDWIRVLRSSGFEVDDLIEVYPPDGATTRYPYVTLPWAQAWPCEEVWKARRLG